MTWLFDLFRVPRRSEVSDAINNAINYLRREMMATIDDIKAAAAEERAEVQAKLKGLQDQIDALTGEVLTPEKAAELIASIRDISEPTPAPAPEAPTEEQ